MPLLLMMLACHGVPRKRNAADAHDAGLSGVRGKNTMQLMLMLLARQGVLGKNAMQLMLMMRACCGGPGKTRCS